MAYHSHFLDIVPERRIVCAYTFEHDGERRLASLVTVELSASGTGTAVRHAEQYAPRTGHRPTRLSSDAQHKLTLVVRRCGQGRVGCRRPTGITSGSAAAQAWASGKSTSATSARPAAPIRFQGRSAA